MAFKQARFWTNVSYPSMRDVGYALDTYNQSLARLTSEAESLDDDDLRTEVQLMTKLLENVTKETERE